MDESTTNGTGDTKNGLQFSVREEHTTENPKSRIQNRG